MLRRVVGDMKLYVVVDIGCIECGEDTAVLGIYKSREDAEQKHKLGSYFSGGQHSVEVFEVCGE